MSYSKEQSDMMFRYAEKFIEQSRSGVNREDLPYIQTYYGKKIRPLWPIADDICIEDVAHGLSNTCRFTGQISKFYSVAQHAVLVSYECPEEYAFEGLHHDDSEAFYSDIPRPLKRAPGMEFYRVYERLITEAINEHFNLRPEPECVKQADFRLLETEARDLFHYENTWAGQFAKPLEERIIPWTSKQAEKRYLERHYELKGGIYVDKTL